MGLFEQFPYTNFHELNLDWLIETMKTLGISFDNLKEYVDDYLKDENIANVVNDRINEMLQDGTFQEIFVQSWLYGKKIVVYGDSTTQLNTSYIKKLEAMGADITNRGVSGSAITTNNDHTGAIDLIPNASDLNNFDYVFMCYGSNDCGGWYYSYPGSSGMKNSNTDIYYCLDTIFNKLNTVGVSGVFVLPSLIHQDAWGEYQTNTYTGSTQDFTNDIIISKCIDWKIEYFNMYTLTPVNIINYQTYYENEKNNIWIHPNNLLNTIMLFQILARNSNNGYSIPYDWTDVSNCITSPCHRTENQYTINNIVNVSDTSKNDALFFINNQRTSQFTINSPSIATLRLEYITSLSALTGRTQIALCDEIGNEIKQISYYSRPNTKTRITFNISSGTYSFRLWNENENTMALIDFKMFIANGTLSPRDYIFTGNSLINNADLRFNFLKDGILIKSKNGIQIAASGTVNSGTVLGTLAPAFDLDIQACFYLCSVNSVYPLHLTASAVVSYDTLTNNMRYVAAFQKFNYENYFLE